MLVALDRPEEFGATLVELMHSRVDVVDLEKRHGPGPQELVVAMAPPEDRDAIAVRERGLRRRLLFEFHGQPEPVAKEGDHLVVALGANAEPADPEHLHRHCPYGALASPRAPACS